MVCWLALCLGRKVEERLGKKCQGAVRGRKGTEGEGEEGWKLQNWNHFRYTLVNRSNVFFTCHLICVWSANTRDQINILNTKQSGKHTEQKGKSSWWGLLCLICMYRTQNHSCLRRIKRTEIPEGLPGKKSYYICVIKRNILKLLLWSGELAFFFCGGLLVWGGVPLSG